MSPLFEADRVRVDVHGSPAVDGLSIATTGDHVLVIGAARALFEAASGVRAIARGELRIAGESPTVAVRAGRLAGAPLDAPFPPKWTPREYATWSARLVGHTRAVASSLASEAIDRMKMTSVADAPLVRAPLIVRRATAIAAAIATSAEIVALDDPLAGLAEEQARSLARVVSRALDDRRWLVFAPRVPLASPLALNADEAIVVSGSDVAVQGAPAEIASRERAYALRLHGETSTFARRVMERGGRVAGTAARMTVELGELTTGDLVRIATESNAVILELFPLGASFA
jgi:ABC-2 type transport system ATP-binding protein